MGTWAIPSAMRKHVAKHGYSADACPADEGVVCERHSGRVARGVQTYARPCCDDGLDDSKYADIWRK